MGGVENTMEGKQAVRGMHHVMMTPPKGTK